MLLASYNEKIASANGKKQFGSKKKKQKKKREDNCNEFSNRNNNNNNRNSKNKTNVYILGDGMAKKLNGYLLTKKIRHENLVKVRLFSGAKTSYMTDYVKPALREINPDHIILHVGINDLKTENTASQIANATLDLVTSLKKMATP